MSVETVKTRLFIISDTHSFESKESISTDMSFRPPFPKVDVLLHTGDLTGTGTVEENKKAIELLALIPAELKLVMAGNHDLTLDKDYYTAENSFAKAIDSKNYNKENAEIVEELWKGKMAKDAGITFLTEGVHDFKLLNGAHFTVYASEWQPEFFNWAFNYAHNEDRWNPPELISKVKFPKDPKLSVIPATRDPHPIPKDQSIDIIMTHGPPWMHGDLCEPHKIRAGCPQLLQALDRVRPRLHCFGHIHEGWGADRVTWRSEPQSSTYPVWSESDEKLGEKTELIGSLTETGANIQSPTDAEVIQRRGAYIDVSLSSGRPLQYGLESLLINSSIMDITYKPVQAGWIVDLELPKSKTN